MCERRTSILFLFSSTIGLIIELGLFLSLFYFKYNDTNDITVRILSSFMISLPISIISTIIIFFIMYEHTNLYNRIEDNRIEETI